uniref:Holocytochrome c-type synthase n=1 Tax=Arcella intermedia TaxID=1963864 RepID=A0A6B2L6V6_9EUKA
MKAVQDNKPPEDSACPVKSNYKSPHAYNVYGERINPDNQIELNANQLPVPGQAAPLPTERVKSSIPKGGTSETWTYPSPQMFYSSLVRKEKDSGIHLDDVEMVVGIHNNMNEHTWTEVMLWEKEHKQEGCEVSLLKFRGRPHDLSPTARFWTWLGYEAPFDRHDWIVDRCGREVRYIIDYYYNEQNTSNPDPSVSNIKIHVRPALDSFEGVLDRLKARIGRTFKIGGRIGGYTAPPPLNRRKVPETVNAEVIPAEEFNFLADLNIETVTENAKKIENKCQSFLHVSQNFPEDENNAIALTYCMGEVVCPKRAEQWMKLMSDPHVSEQDIQNSFTDLTTCLTRYYAQVAKFNSSKPYEHLQTKPKEEL